MEKQIKNITGQIEYFWIVYNYIMGDTQLELSNSNQLY